MVHAKDVLANQLLANANDPSWHLPFIQAVEAVTEEEAFWKPGAGLNSIAELTGHLLYWNETWQSRYRAGRVDAVPPVGDNNRSFVVPEGTAFSELREACCRSCCNGRPCCPKRDWRGRWKDSLNRLPGGKSSAMRLRIMPTISAKWLCYTSYTSRFGSNLSA